MAASPSHPVTANRRAVEEATLETSIHNGPVTSLPDVDLRRIERFCAEQWPEGFLDEVFWEMHVRGRNVTVCETRAPFDGSDSPWTHFRIAQLRYRPDDKDWALYWADRNDRWHAYDPTGAALKGTCAELLAEIDADPTAIFKG